MHSEKRKVVQFQGSTRDPGGGKSDVMVFMNVAGRANRRPEEIPHCTCNYAALCLCRDVGLQSPE